jgi:TonB family protein
MFNNLIESSSHLREFKRRGSFVLFTSATYALLFIVAGVISIYAYDARLEDQNTEFVTMLSPMELPPAPTREREAPAPRNNSNAPSHAVREVAMSRVDHPEVVPQTVSAVASKNIPVPKSGIYTIGPNNSDPIDPGGSGHTGPGGSGNNNTGPASLVKIDTPPPPQPPLEKRVARTISKGPITGDAKLLPKPPYPPLARQIKAQGAVNVQVLIDETGKVISARAVSGHPLLMAAAQQAAYRAVFSPTTLGDQPVKVSGVITYNFILP